MTVGCQRYEAFRRQVLRFDFDVYEGDLTDGVLLARLPFYIRWAKRPAPTSKLARFLHVARMEPSRGRPVSLSALRGKLFRIRVVDAEKDAGGHPLTPETTYSVVAEVLERLV